MKQESKGLREIQKEIGTWSGREFGGNPSRDICSVSCGSPLGSLPALLGMQEELGELARVVARRHQGRGYSPEEAQSAKIDALGDLLIFACDFAEREGIDLLTALEVTWTKVQLRRRSSWVEDKLKEEQNSAQA